jgi:KUP system potassium uptake protein
MEQPTIQDILECTDPKTLHIDPDSTSFFLTGQNLVPTADKGLPRWREGAFIFMTRNAQKASEYFRMPCDRTIEIDWQAEI